MQFARLDGNAGSQRAKNEERVLDRFVPIIAPEQRSDQASRKLLGTDEVRIGEQWRCRATLPREYDGNRLAVLRDPDSINASESQDVVAARSMGAKFVLLMPKHDGIENCSVLISDGHNCILRPSTNGEPVLVGLSRAQYDNQS